MDNFFIALATLIAVTIIWRHASKAVKNDGACSHCSKCSNCCTPIVKEKDEDKAIKDKED